MENTNASNPIGEIDSIVEKEKPQTTYTIPCKKVYFEQDFK